MRSWLPVLCLAPLLLISTACGAKDPEALKREYVASGDRYLSQKRLSEAILQYRNAVAQDARFGEARFKLAAAYQENGNLGDALREFVRAADLMPNNIDAQNRAGALLLANNQFAEAQARAAMALEIDPQNATALILMGNALARLKDLDGAITQIEDAIDAQPTVTFSYANLGWLKLQKGDVGAAEGAFKRALEVAPASVPAHLNLANFYWAAQRFTDAERVLQEAIRLDAKSPEANRMLAALYVNSNQNAKAEPYLKAFAANSTGPEGKLILADFYMANKRSNDAAIVLTGLAKTEDGYVEATRRLAGIAFEGGRKTEAYALIEQILARKPQDEMTQHAKASFLSADGKFDEAITLADSIVEKNARAVRTQYLRALTFRSMGRLDDAIDAMKKAMQYAPGSFPAQGLLAQLYLAKGNGAGALELSTVMVKEQPRSGAAHLLLAQSLLVSGNVAAAEQELLPLAARAPESPEIQTWLGRLYLAKNDRARARQAFTKAVALAPSDLQAVNGLITLDLVDKRFDAVRSRLDTLLGSESGKRPATLFLAGNTYAMLGDTARAEQVFLDVLKADAGFTDAYARLGQLYVAQGRLDDARHRFEQASQSTESAVAAITMIGVVLEMQHKPDEARKQYERALAIDARAPVAANNLAWLLAERGENLDQALQLAQAAKSSQPNNAGFSNTLGWVYYKKGLFTQAISALREGAEQSPSDPSKHYYLGLAYLKANEAAKARESLERALKLNPQFAQATDARELLASLKG